MEVEAATQGDGDGCDPGSRFRPPPTAERRHLPRAPMDAISGPVFQSPATEDETIARKRSRRVSFADTTAVHVFDRDEDSETPLEERPASPSPSPGRPLAAEGDETEGEEEFVRPPVVFLGDVDLGSASPATAAGSFSSFDGEPGMNRHFFSPGTGRQTESVLQHMEVLSQVEIPFLYSLVFGELTTLQDWTKK